MIGRAAVGLAVAALLTACAPLPSPTTVQTATLAPEPTPTAPPPARVTVDADGLVGCEWMLGCSAIVAIEVSTDPNAPLPEDWYPEDEIRLAVRMHPEGDGSTLIVEDPLTEPPPIGPGTYRVVGAWVYMDDLVSPPASGPGYSVIRSTCVDDLVVREGAAYVEIAVSFALSTDCSVAVVAS